ncbi:MAG: sigma-70 family RNA polymerase sigma factor [Acidobacteriota bacterium]|nr:MAG: sigma-70 family RNA polymerase sigma factor [Acidobacteriota bacterium]
MSSYAPSSRNRTPRRVVRLFLEDARRLLAVYEADASEPPGLEPDVEEVARSDSAAARVVAESLNERVRELVEPHLFYVVQVAGEFRSRDIPFEDLLAEGNVGLVEAAHHYDPSHEVKFLTYASWWIRKRILDHLAREGKPVRLTRYAREKRRRLRLVRDTMRAQLGREPTADELSRESGLPISSVDEDMSSTLVVVPLEQTRVEGGATLQERLPDSRVRDPEQTVLSAQVRAEVLAEVARLPYRERLIIRNRFGLDGGSVMTFQQLGQRLDVSRERARQIEQEALSKLRRRLRRRLTVNGTSSPLGQSSGWNLREN